MNFPILNSSCKWDHTMFVLFCLAYLSMFLRCIHVIACTRMSFVYMVNNTPLFVYSILLIYLSVGHVGCFHLLTVVNNSAMNKFMSISLRSHFQSFESVKVNWPEYMVVLRVTFQGKTKWLSIVPAPFYIPTSKTHQ